MRYVVSFSGGVGSFVAAAMTIAKHGRENTDLIFCDTLIEDSDLYRFLDDAEKALGVGITRLKDGRTPWEVFRDVRYIGNSRLAPCSKVLKRDVFEKYLLESGRYRLLPQPDATIVLGIDWTESHRLKRAQDNWAPWPVIGPLCEPPLMSKAQTLRYFEAYNIPLPSLYGKGFSHNNCGGFCVRAGQAQFALLLKTNRDYYLWHESQEQDVLHSVPTTRPFLRKVTKGVKEYLTLKQFREQLESDGDFDKFDFGGCGCFVDDPKSVGDTSGDIFDMFGDTDQ